MIFNDTIVFLAADAVVILYGVGMVGLFTGSNMR